MTVLMGAFHRHAHGLSAAAVHLPLAVLFALSQRLRTVCSDPLL